MQNIIHAVTTFFAPKSHRIIKCVNECDETVYIEIPGPESRREELNILFTKCKKLVSFVTKKTWDEDAYVRLVKLSENVRLAMYQDNDTTHLFEEFENIQDFFRKSSRSFINLNI